MEQTIAAVATPNAAGGISVIRVSGQDAFAVCDRCFQAASGKKLTETEGYRALYGSVWDGEQKLDEAIALVFHSPHSYTGENVVEISCHGGIYVTRAVLRAVLQCGARLAGPGEFTKRAFLNGKLSLTQAEAVADMIAAQGGQAAKAALTAMEGSLFRQISALRDRLLTAAGHLAAWADYPEEEIPAVDRETLADTLGECAGTLGKLLADFDSGRLVRSGINTVIAGRPNVGKSTLMNLLAGCRKSIVTEIAGTTRDVIEESVQLGGMLLNLADTAGLRETDDVVEQAGVQLSREKLARADLVLALFDSSAPLGEEDFAFIRALEGRPAVAVVNKTDLGQALTEADLRQYFKHIVYISAKNADGIEHLTQAIQTLLKTSQFDPNAPMLANERQRAAAEAAASCLEEALEALRAGLTLDAVTVSVEGAAEALLELTGERVTDAVVDEVFSHFCVGK